MHGPAARVVRRTPNAWTLSAQRQKNKSAALTHGAHTLRSQLACACYRVQRSRVALMAPPWLARQARNRHANPGDEACVMMIRSRRTSRQGTGAQSFQ
jgi:hypothetical protein